MTKTTLATGTGLSVVLTAISGIAINNLGNGWFWTLAVIVSVGLTALVTIGMAVRARSANPAPPVQVNSAATVFAVQNGQQTIVQR